MTRKAAFAIATSLLACFVSLAETAPKPNVLFIAVDDLRPELGCYRNTQVHSPNIDKLASSGLLFNAAYCQQGVCTPSRASLLTGQRPDTNGVHDLTTSFREKLPDAITLPQRFQQAGYHIESYGKIFHVRDEETVWSNPQKTRDPGEIYALPENRAIMSQNRKRFAEEKTLPRHGPYYEKADVSDLVYRDGVVASNAIDALGRFKSSGKPFFLAVGFVKPHLPFAAPAKYWDLYDPKDIEIPEIKEWPEGMPGFAATHLEGHRSWELRSYQGMDPAKPVTEEQAVRLIHGYYACISYMDALLGRIMDELDRLELRQNTLVILWGDHGFKLGEFNAWAKHSNFELDTRAPLILATPDGKAAGHTSDALVEFIDIYPTLCDLAGLEIPEDLPGKSMRPLLDNPQAAFKSAAYSQYPRTTEPRGQGQKLMGYAMRTERFRYVEWRERDSGAVYARELYDLETKRIETMNLSGDPQYQETIASLSRQMAKDLNLATLPRSTEL